MNVGAILSIRVTVAVADQVLPASSLNWKINDPLPVKVYSKLPPLLVTIIYSDMPVNVATTLPEVYIHDAGLYSTLAVGGILSIQ